jgi:hypothetical protein
MDMARDRYGRGEKCTQYFGGETLKERDHYEDLGNMEGWY